MYLHHEQQYYNQDVQHFYHDCPEENLSSPTVGPTVGATRKLSVADFHALDRDDVDDGSSDGHKQDEKCKQPLAEEQHVEQVVAHTLDEFYMPIHGALQGLLNLLKNTPPADATEVMNLSHDVRCLCNDPNRASSVEPRYGLVMASQVVDLVEAEITERDTPGLMSLSCRQDCMHGVLRWTLWRPNSGA